ncbi:hypothetical protein NDU88_005157 [Pleurodeles waltl]|uniref:Uncharacterized protein n=1 Tax=Pleurodeles waltl TaxID=8319 RepID=A0AAV7PEW3_PLEWA|nr:hypothetical protein NDU88_005157 [Pleurodeles waltl]
MERREGVGRESSRESWREARGGRWRDEELMSGGDGNGTREAIPGVKETGEREMAQNLTRRCREVKNWKTRWELK